MRPSVSSYYCRLHTSTLCVICHFDEHWFWYEPEWDDTEDLERRQVHQCSTYCTESWVQKSCIVDSQFYSHRRRLYFCRTRPPDYSSRCTCRYAKKWDEKNLDCTSTLLLLLLFRIWHWLSGQIIIFKRNITEIYINVIGTSILTILLCKMRTRESHKYISLEWFIFNHHFTTCLSLFNETSQYVQ